MSELYLVLRRRLESVRRWVQVPTDVLRDARKTQGLSYEATGRLLNISSKTYERYEKQGRLPLELVDAIADVLGLTIERPDIRPGVVQIPPIHGDRLPAEAPTVQALREELADVRASLARVEELLAGEEPSRASRRQA